MLLTGNTTKAAWMGPRKSLPGLSRATSRRAGSPGSSTNLAVHVRQWCPDKDLQAVSSLWQEALLLTGWTSHGPKQEAAHVSEVTGRAQMQLQRSHQRKSAAAQQVRSLRQQAEQILPAQAVPGHPAALHVSTNNIRTSRHQLRQISESLMRLRRKRMWMCLVACMRDSREAGTSCATSQQSCSKQQVHGYVLLSLAQPLALLPPPFPSTAPWMLHIDALAVSPSCRRQGVGTALLCAAERLAARWGRQSLWLEVDAANHAAIALYVRQGYHVSCTLGWPRRKKQKLLMCKNLPPRMSCGSQSMKPVSNV